jgi:hypothetical protein
MGYLFVAPVSRCPGSPKVGGDWTTLLVGLAPQDRANIDDDELAEFRKLMKAYGGITPKQINRLLQDQDWMEICNGNQA